MARKIVSKGRASPAAAWVSKGQLEGGGGEAQVILVEGGECEKGLCVSGAGCRCNELGQSVLEEQGNNYKMAAGISQQHFYFHYASIFCK